MVLTSSPELEGEAHGAPLPAGPWWAGWWLLPPVVLGILGGLLVARDHSFWYDELFTAEMAALPLRRLLDAVVSGEGTIDYLRDAPPSYNGPYYAVAHLWAALTPFGADEVGLRLLSLAAAIAAVGVFSRAAARLAGRRAGLVAGLVMAANPFVVAYSAEARGYSLALLATALAALGLARWLDGRPRSLALYGAGATAASLAHWYALLVVLSFAVAALILRRRRAGPLLLVSGLAAIPALAVVGTAVANGVGSSGAQWIQGAGAAVPGLVLRSWVGGNVALLVATVLAVGAAFVPRRSGDGQARVVAVLWVGLPVGAVTAAQALRPVYVDRYLLPAVIALALLAAVGVTRLPRPAATLAALGLLITSVAVTVPNAGRGPREDIRGALAAVAAAHREGEPVVAAARWDALGVDHYARRHHPGLVVDLVLAPSTVPTAASLWMVRRATGGVKGDLDKRADLDRQLADRRMRLVERRLFDGRRADVLVERWEAEPAG